MHGALGVLLIPVLLLCGVSLLPDLHAFFIVEMVVTHHPFSVFGSFVTQKRTDPAAIKFVLLPIHLNTFD